MSENVDLLNLKITSENGDDRYVIFTLAEGTFAVNCKYVVSIEPPAKITEMANAPAGVRGVGYYKDEAINIFDLRIIFGYPTHEYYVENNINIGRHITEHENWASEISSSVAGGDELSFTSDPFGCDLGKWLESYKTDNMNIKNLVKRIKPVHEQFHKFANRTAGFSSNDKDETDKFLAEAQIVKNELMRNLSELNSMLLSQAKELTIILKIKDKKIGIIIDDAESVESMDEIQELPPVALVTEYIRNLGFRSKDKQIALIIEAEMFV